jgi:integrase
MRTVIFDRNIPFQEAYGRLRRLIKYYAEVDDPLRLCYYCTLLTTLLNGARIGEAVEAFNKFLDDGSRNILIRIEKRKDNGKRLIIIPSFVTDEYRYQILSSSVQLNKKSIVQFARRHLINCHSLRFSFVRFMIENGVDNITLSNLLGHKSISMVMTYARNLNTNILLNKFVSSF